MPFYNREKDIRRMKAVLSGEPNLVYFVYGPINSGKTALLVKVLAELPDKYRVFYINFRGVETRRYEDFVRALFTVRYKDIWKKIKEKGELLEAALKFGEQVLKKINSKIIVPSEIVKAFLKKEDEEGDCFYYLEELMRHLNRKDYRPVLVLDELQMLREVNKNGPVLHDLFNFFVRMTKETHLCHCLCATSDCLFIENVYSNARLEGRAKYILVDDLTKEEAFEIYDSFRFKNKELVWEYIGGKVGDIVGLFEEKKQGFEEEEALKKMLRDEVARLEIFLRTLKYSPLRVQVREVKVKVGADEFKKGLKVFGEKDEILATYLEEPVLLGGIQENILFYNPIEGTVRPQSRLLAKAIKKLVS